MGTELILAIAGPFLGATFGLTTFLYRRATTKVDNQLQTLGGQVESVLEQVIDLKVTLPTNYVTKDELMAHIKMEDGWQNETSAQIRELRSSIDHVRDVGTENQMRLKDLKYHLDRQGETRGYNGGYDHTGRRITDHEHYE